MTRDVVLGIDIGTSSSKGVITGLQGGVLGVARRAHGVQRPAADQVEMDGALWWDEFVSMTRELCCGSQVRVRAVGVSGMGPCTLLTDSADVPVRPAILYGVDTRAGDQITALTERYGCSAILSRTGSILTSQAVGPKLAWLADHEPERYRAGRRLFMASSYLVYRLTGEYVLDHILATGYSADRTFAGPGGSPGSMLSWTVDARRMAASSRRLGWDSLRLRIGDQFVVAHRLVGDGEFEHPVEDHASAARAASVEPEDELVEIALQMRLFDRTLVRAQQPPLGQRRDPVDTGEQLAGIVSAGPGGTLAARLVCSRACRYLGSRSNRR